MMTPNKINNNSCISSYILFIFNSLWIFQTYFLCSSCLGIRVQISCKECNWLIHLFSLFSSPAPSTPHLGPWTFAFLPWLKKPAPLSCGISNGLNFADCILMVPCNTAFCPFISCKLVVGSQGLVRFRVHCFSACFTGGLITWSISPKWTMEVWVAQG